MHLIELNQEGLLRKFAIAIPFLLVAYCPTRLSTLDPGSAPVKPPPARRTLAQVQEVYSKLPLGFERNDGQTSSQVKFLSRGGGHIVFLTANEAVLALQKSRSEIRNQKSKIENALAPGPQSLARAVLRLKLIGANRAPEVRGFEELPGKSNYFLGNDPRKWHRNVPTYARVQYKAVYPGVDLAYYGKQGKLEFDFVVAPGADPRAIKLTIEGAARLRLDREGNLVAQLHGDEFRFHKPFIYQPTTERERSNRAVLEGGYLLRGSDTVGFRVTSFDARKPLIIDPVLSYSTYLGGSDVDQGKAIAVGTNGSVYVTGTTSSANFPTRGAFQGSPSGGGSDAFVTKIDTTRSGDPSLIYSTYLGGTGADAGSGIAVDSGGSAYVTGQTASTDFPTSNAYRSVLSGSTDAFLTVLNPAGSALVYSTYLGGSLGTQAGLGVAVDDSSPANGLVYVTGQTTSANFPVLNAYQTVFGGGTCSPPPLSPCPDVFVAKINTTLAGQPSLLYSTYLGGSGADVGNGIAADSAGNAYVTGSTSSANFPTRGAFQDRIGGGTDAFVARIDTRQSGVNSLIYSTYLGGNNTDFGTAIAVSTNVNSPNVVYVTGQTATPFPTTPGAFQVSPAGGTDAFVCKIDTSQTGTVSLIYSTYLGGSGNDGGFGIAVDSSGNAYVSGTTLSLNFPLASPLQSSFGGGASDAFVAKINAGRIDPPAPAGSVLIFSTYLGGTGTDAASGIAVDTNGFASVIGQTTSTDFPTQRAFQTTNNGTTNAFLAQLAGLNLPIARLSPTSLSFSPQLVGTTSAPPLNVTLTNVGDGPLILSSPIAFTGTNASDFALSTVGTPCSPNTPVEGGSSCNISVTFTPSAAGARTAAMAVTDNAPGSPQTVSLSGTGICPSPPGPAVILNPNSLSFGSVVLGGTSAAQTVTLTNVCTGDLILSGIAMGGANPADFAITTAGTTCAPGNRLAGGSSCALSVTFAPRTTGTRIAAISIADNAAGSPHPVPLSGAGGEFSLGTSPATATVTAGSSATYTLSITPVGGFNQEVSLSCNDPTTASTCTIAPPSVTPFGSAASMATVTVTTTARSRVMLRRGPRAVPPAGTPLALPWGVWLLAVTILAALSRLTETKRRAWLCLGITILCLVFWATCGGGGSGGPKGTPVGSYVLTFTATSSATPSLSHSISVTLIVN